jgi:hypothetical protein
MRDVVIGYSLLQYGNVMRWGRTVPNAETALLPQGEGFPPLDYWLELLAAQTTLEDVRFVLERARTELQAWRCRPEPPPEGETFDDLKSRILNEGEGWTPQEVALAMRCTPTLVRNVRAESERDVDTGRPDSSLAHGLELLSSGVSLRSAALATGIPKSTLHDAFKRCAPVT